MVNQLPEKSRIKLAWIADQLRHGFTGEFRIVCVDGGIRTCERKDSPSDEQIAEEMLSSQERERRG